MGLTLEFWGWLGFAAAAAAMSYSAWTRRLGPMWRSQSWLGRRQADRHVHVGVCGMPALSACFALWAAAVAVGDLRWLGAFLMLAGLACAGTGVVLTYVAVPRWYGPPWFRRLRSLRVAERRRAAYLEGLIARRPNPLRWAEADVGAWAAPLPAYDELQPFGGRRGRRG